MAKPDAPKTPETPRAGVVRLDYVPELQAIRVTVQEPFAITPVVADVPFDDFMERTGLLLVEAAQASRMLREKMREHVALRMERIRGQRHGG